MTRLKHATEATAEQSPAPAIDNTPIRTIAQLATLDGAEILRGYWVGYDNDPLDPRAVSHSFWHGYLVGQADGGHRELTPAQVELMAEHALLRGTGMH